MSDSPRGIARTAPCRPPASTGAAPGTSPPTPIAAGWATSWIALRSNRPWRLAIRLEHPTARVGTTRAQVRAWRRGPLHADALLQRLHQQLRRSLARVRILAGDQLPVLSHMAEHGQAVFDFGAEFAQARAQQEWNDVGQAGELFLGVGKRRQRVALDQRLAIAACHAD